MNSVALPLVSAAVLAAVLAVHSAAVDSGIRVAGGAADSAAAAAAAGAEALHASLGGDGVVSVRNHGMRQARVLMADFMLDGGGPNGTARRIVFGGGWYDHPPGMDVAVEGGGPVAVPAGGGAELDVGRHLVLGGAPAAVRSAVLVTDTGNRFLVDAPRAQGAPGNGTGGWAGLAALGSSARLESRAHGDGFAVHGNGTAGRTVPVGPHARMDGTADDFAAVVLAGEREARLDAGSLARRYLLHGGGLAEVAGSAPPNELSYSAVRVLEGAARAEAAASGIRMHGGGAVLLRLDGASPGEGLLFSGTVRDAALYVGHSPYDLEAMRHEAGAGFIVWEGPALAPDVRRLEWRCSPANSNEFHAVYEWDVPAGVLVGARGLLSHSAEAASNNNAPHPGGALLPPVLPAAASFHTSSSGAYDSLDRVAMEAGSSPALNGRTDCTRRPADVRPTVYDAAPLSEIVLRSPEEGPFEAFHRLGAGGGALYALADLGAGGEAVLRASAAALEVGGLPGGAPYVLTKAGRELAAGAVPPSGELRLGAGEMRLWGPASAVSHCREACVIPSPRAGPAEHSVPASTIPGGVLRLYPDSFSMRGPPLGRSPVSYDPAAPNHTILPGRGDSFHVVHAWITVPAPGLPLSVERVELDGGLRLPYLEGTIPAGGKLMVPVIPGYASARMVLNGLNVTVSYAEASRNSGGPAGVWVAAPATAEAVAGDPSGPVRTVRAAAEAPALAVVSASDGHVRAVAALQAAGRAWLENSHVVALGPGANATAPLPAPAGPPPGALEGFLDVHLNGAPHGTVRLGPAPAGAASAVYGEEGGSTRTVTHGAWQEHPSAWLHGSASVPVSAGDLVEFSLRAVASGTVLPYAPPDGASVSRSSGRAYAEVAIEAGSIITGE